MPTFLDRERMQLTIFATKGNSMSKQLKFFSRTPIAAAVLAVSAATFTLDAEAALHFLREVKGPVAVTGAGATAKYSFSIQMRVINDDNIPATGTSPSPVAIQIVDAIKASFPSAIQNSVVVSNLRILSEDVGCDSTTYECMIPTGAKTPTPFTPVTDLTLNSGFKGVTTGTDKGDEIFATGQKLDPYSVVTVRYDVEFAPGAETGPFNLPATMNGKEEQATFILPAAPSNHASVCPPGTVPNTVNLVKNGDFATPYGKALTLDDDGNPTPLAPDTDIASFKSDFRFAGDNAYPHYKEISLITEIPETDISPGASNIVIRGFTHFQYPFPGAKEDGDIPAVPGAKGYLLGAGAGVDGKGGIWKQTVTGLNGNENYQFEAWVSNPAPVGADGDDPKISLKVGTDTSDEFVLDEDTPTDAWHQISLLVNPNGRTSLDLAVVNSNADEGNYNLHAVTAIALRRCVDPDDLGKADPGDGTNGDAKDSDDNAGGSNSGGGTGSDAGSDGATADTGSGGGGGALGFALAGMGLIGLRRRFF